MTIELRQNHRDIPAEEMAAGTTARALYQRIKRFEEVEGRVRVPRNLTRAVEMYGFYARRRLRIFHEPGKRGWSPNLYPAWIVVETIRQPLYQMTHPAFGALVSIEDVPEVLVMFTRRGPDEPPDENAVLALLAQGDTRRRSWREAEEQHARVEEKARKDIENEEDDFSTAFAYDLATMDSIHSYVPRTLPRMGPEPMVTLK